MNPVRCPNCPHLAHGQPSCQVLGCTCQSSALAPAPAADASGEACARNSHNEGCMHLIHYPDSPMVMCAISTNSYHRDVTHRQNSDCVHAVATDEPPEIRPTAPAETGERVAGPIDMRVWPGYGIECCMGGDPVCQGAGCQAEVEARQRAALQATAPATATGDEGARCPWVDDDGRPCASDKKYHMALGKTHTFGDVNPRPPGCSAADNERCQSSSPCVRHAALARAEQAATIKRLEAGLDEAAAIIIALVPASPRKDRAIRDLGIARAAALAGEPEGGGA